MESMEIAGHDQTGGILADWISRNELARELGITTDTLGRWAAQRKGPAYVKAGRKIFYRRDVVRAWLQSKEVQPVKPARRGRR